MKRSEAKIALQLEFLQREICDAEAALLVRHNKNIGYDLRRLLNSKRKLADFLKKKSD